MVCSSLTSCEFSAELGGGVVVLLEVVVPPLAERVGEVGGDDGEHAVLGGRLADLLEAVEIAVAAPVVDDVVGFVFVLEESTHPIRVAAQLDADVL